LFFLLVTHQVYRSSLLQRKRGINERNKLLDRN